VKLNIVVCGMTVDTIATFETIITGFKNVVFCRKIHKLNMTHHIIWAIFTKVMLFLTLSGGPDDYVQWK
jgi:hypothetical protein